MSARAWKTAAQALLVAVAYFVTGWLGLMRPALGSHITLIWLPTGIAVAALLRYGTGCWPGITLGALSVNLAYVTGLPASLAIAVGNTLGPLLAVWTLRRIGFRPAFDRQRDILLLGLAAVLGMLVSASGGVASLSLAGGLPGDRFTAWLAWWAGDTMGVILGAPLVFAFSRSGVRTILVRRVEFAVWLCVTGVVTWCVFAQNRGAGGEPWSLAFVSLPLVAWAALRYGPAGTAVAVIVLAVGAAYGTVTGRGPLFRAHPVEGSAVLWLFMASSAVLGWLVSAMQAARVQATGIQRLLEHALSDVSLGVLLAGLDRRITYANQGFTRLTGYTEAELLGKSCGLLQGADTDPAIGKKLKAALHGDGFFDGEILNYRKDGTTFWNALLISPVHDESGAMTGFLGIQRDITKRKRAEMALHQSEEHLRQIIEIEPECVKLLSPDGRLIEMNPAGLAMIEATSIDQVRDRPVANLIVPEHRAAFAEVHQRVMAGGTGRCEFEIIGLKGTRRWLETHAVPYRDARREIIGALGITRDITHLKQAQEALLKSHERLERRVEERTVELRQTVASLGRENTIRKEAEEALRRSHESLEQRVAERTAELRHAVDRLEEENADRRRAEEAVRASEDLFRRIIDYAPEAIMLLDVTSGRFVQVNPAAERLFKHSAAELSELGLSALSPPEQPDGRLSSEKAQEFVSRAMAGEAPAFEWMHRDAEGRDIPCEVRLLRIEVGGRVVVRSSTTDISARKRVEAEQEQFEHKLQETQKLESLGILAGGIAHDFNNLLTSVLGNASIAAMELPVGSPVQDCLEQITEASLRAADLCKQMLAYSGRGRFVVQTLDLGQLVEHTTQMLQISISKKAVLRFRLEKNLPPVDVDATQIRQVIMNLVINASEAIGDRSGVISLSTGLTRVDRDYLGGTLMDANLPEGEYVYLEVSDTGCGMSPDTQAKIFDPFFTTKFTGRGLGLAAVIGIVRGHKGAMKVYSEVGRGTTFKLLFPAARGVNEAASAPPAAEPWHGEGTVLVVDDEETMRSTVARMMRLFGLKVVLAEDGREAVKIFHADPERFAFVLLDLTMPHMDGEQTFTELRRLRPDVRVVLMSGFNAQEAMLRFTGKGLANFLQKPFAVGELRAVVQEVMG